MVIMQKFSQQFKILQKNEPKNTYVKTSKMSTNIKESEDLLFKNY